MSFYALGSLKSKFRLLVFFLLPFLFLTFTAKSSFAADYQLSGTVTDNSSNAIDQATVHVYNVGTTADAISPTTTNSSGAYSFSTVPQGTYDVKVVPSGTGFSSAIAPSQNINSNTTLNFVLTNAGSVTISGYIHDADGNILPGQYVRLKSGSNYIATTIADNNGYFSLTAAPATYILEFQFIDTGYTYNLPTNYLVQVDNYSLSQDVTNLNITLPLKKVDVHVENGGGTAVSGVILSANNIDWANNLNIGGGITTARGTSVYNSPGRATNASG